MKKLFGLAYMLLTATLSSASFAQDAKNTYTVVRSSQWGANNLNPFLPGDQHLLPTNSAIYESLFYVNSLNGKVDNVLGTAYKWSADNKSLTVTTRGGVKWTDGQAFDSGDVVFTYNYLKQFPALDTNGIWKNGLSSIKASGPNTVVFTFSEPNTPIFFLLSSVPIVPEHLWKEVKEPLTFTNQKPIATGPFTFDSYSQQALRVLKNPNYWMKGQPYVDAVVWLATSSNDAALLKLMNGEADFGYVGITDPKGGFAAKSSNNVYWWPVNNSNILYLNNTKAPFSDVAFRKALAKAIDTNMVAEKAYAGVVKAANSSAVIPAQQAQWLPDSAKTMAVKFDSKAADTALTAAGYKKNSSGQRLDKNGQPLPSFKILVGAGWTDFITMAQVISENLKTVGIGTSIDQQTWSSYSGGLQSATYDMGISWGWGNGPSPYYLFYGSFSPSQSAPVGKTAPSNLTRYTNATVTKALQTFRSSSSPDTQKKAIATIVTQVMKDQPWIPLTDRSQFALFNTSKFTGMPSEANPYNDGSPDDTNGARLMYLNVKAK